MINGVNGISGISQVNGTITETEVNEPSESALVGGVYAAVVIIMIILLFIKASLGLIRLLDKLFDHVWWLLHHIPIFGRFFYRYHWDVNRYLTIQDHVSSFVRIKVEVRGGHLNSPGEVCSGHSCVEIFAEAADPITGVIGGPGHRFKLVKEESIPGAESWPNVSFEPVLRIT